MGPQRPQAVASGGVSDQAESGTAGALRRTVIPPQGGILHPFRPGQSGNPAGGALPKRRLAVALAEVLDARGGPKAVADALLTIALDPANKAAVAAIREVFERLDGPTVKKLEHAHEHTAVEVRKVRLVAEEPVESAPPAVEGPPRGLAGQAPSAPVPQPLPDPGGDCQV